MVRPSTAVIAVSLVLIVVPIPVLPPFVGFAIGVLGLFCGLLLRLLGL